MISIDPKSPGGEIIQLILISVDPKITRRRNNATHINECRSKNHQEDTYFSSYQWVLIQKITMRTNGSNHTGISASWETTTTWKKGFLTNLYKGNCPQKDLLSIWSQIQQINHQKTTGRVFSPNYVEVVLTTSTNWSHWFKHHIK